MKTSIIKDVEGYDGYRIGTDGFVRSCRTRKEKIIKGCTAKNGYTSVILKRLDGTLRSELVHRLVAKAFIKNEDNKPTVDHINGHRSDNRSENLRWATNSENMKNVFRLRGDKLIVKNKERKWMKTLSVAELELAALGELQAA